MSYKISMLSTTARSSTYTSVALTATRVSQQPIRVLPWRLPLEESPERWRLAHDCSELSLHGPCPDGYLSESTTYTGPTLTATLRGFS